MRKEKLPVSEPYRRIGIVNSMEDMALNRIIIILSVVLYTACNTFVPLPEYYNGYLDTKVEEISALREDEADGFFYWTDTHFPENSGYAPAIMNYIQDRIGPVKKFYGGDATKNAPALSPGMDLFSSSLQQAGEYGSLYLIRGNHDFTSTTSDLEPDPETMDNEQVSGYIRSFCASDAVWDRSAGTGNYYYVDSRNGRIRYVVFDSTENVADGRVEYGISASQIKWVFGQAVATLPEGWSLIFMSHVPVDPRHTKCDAITQVADSIVASDISKNTLLCLAGHRHSDIESGIGSVFQVLTEADCLKDCARTVTPYSFPLDKKCPGSVNEHTIDYVSVSRDHAVITFKRIGHGYDRVFNIRPIEVAVGEIVKLPSGTLGTGGWTVYDANTFVIGAYEENGIRMMQIMTEDVEHKGEDVVVFGRAGNFIAVHVLDDGTKVYYMYTVKK